MTLRPLFLAVGIATLALRPSGVASVRRNVVAPNDARRHVALLIGISDYKNFAEGGPPGRSKLHAPVANDLPRVERALSKWGFRAGPDMTVLRDSQATRQGITSAFEWLDARVDTGDVVFIYYSGHGSSAPDLDGDEAKIDPNDHYDEALVPWDVKGDTGSIHDPNQLIIDDQIGQWLGRLRSANVTIVVDACYSGTITRGGLASYRPRGSLPPAGVATPAKPSSGLDGLLPRQVLLTAAASNQTAGEWEFATGDGKRTAFGILTYYFTEALDAANEGTHYDDLMRHVEEGLASLQGSVPHQDPQLEGDHSALLFHVSEPVPAQQVVAITPLSDTTVGIDAGAVNGVRPSAQYDVFGAGETTFRGEPPYGRIEIDSVTRFQGFGRRVDARTSPIPRGARAILSIVPYGVRRLTTISVFAPPDDPAISTIVRQFPAARVVSQTADRATADVVLAARNGTVRVFAHAAEIKPLDASTQVVAGADTGFAPTAAAICGALTRAYMISALSLIENPAMMPPIDVRLVAGDTVPSEFAPYTALDTAFIGQSYTLWVRAHVPDWSTLYLTVAIAGYLGDPTVLYPAPSSAGTFPTAGWQAIYRNFSVTEPHGLEQIKVVAADKQYSLQSLAAALPQCGAKEVSRWLGPPSRSAIKGWGATTRSILILPARQ